MCVAATERSLLISGRRRCAAVVLDARSTMVCRRH